MDYLEYLGRRLVWLVVSLLAIAWLILVTYFILYLFTVVTFFLSWHSLTLNNVLEVILQTVLIIPILYTLFVSHNEVIKKVDELLSAKKE